MIRIDRFSKGKYSGIKEIEQNMPERYGCVYILEYGNYVKIGYTTKPYKRISGLKNMANYADCELGNVAILPCCRNYGQIEGKLHKKFAQFRKPNTELFDMKFDDALTEIRKMKLEFKTGNYIEADEEEEIYPTPPSIMDMLGYYEWV